MWSARAAWPSAPATPARSRACWRRAIALANDIKKEWRNERDGTPVSNCAHATVRTATWRRCVEQEEYGLAIARSFCRSDLLATDRCGYISTPLCMGGRRGRGRCCCRAGARSWASGCLARAISQAYSGPASRGPLKGLPPETWAEAGGSRAPAHRPGLATAHHYNCTLPSSSGYATALH